MLDYQIVVPSRKRVHNMLKIRSLLPTAIVCVDEREEAEYRVLVPSKQLVTHPAFDGLDRVLNFCIGHFQAKCLIFIDDDLQRVLCRTGSNRRITDPGEILTILENAMHVASDVGATTFCFSRTMNPAFCPPEYKPILPTQPICAAFGVMGAARHRVFDTSYLGRGDIDWALTTYQEDRFTYADVRFYFDFGRTFAGRGGNVGLVTDTTMEQSTRLLREKWGQYVGTKAPGFQKQRSTAVLSLKVSRTNPTAQR